MIGFNMDQLNQVVKLYLKNPREKRPLCHPFQQEITEKMTFKTYK